MKLSYYNQYNMPPQKLATSEKVNEDGTPTEWGKRCVDAIINMSSSSTANNGRASKTNKDVNYRLYNSIFDEEDFEYVLNPYGAAEQYGESPAKMQNYNIIRSKIELLKGEEIKRPFNYICRGVGGEIVTVREQKKREMILQMLDSMVTQQLGKPLEEGEEPQTPAQIQKYMDTQWMDPREVTANQLLKYIVLKENAEMKFNQGWEHALIAAEEIYHVGIVSGEPSLRTVNPLDFDYDKDEDLKFIEDAQWCKEERWLTPGTILDLHGDVLSEKEIERLDRGELYNSADRGMQHSFAYNPDAFNQQANRPQNGVYVVNVCWKSMRKIGFLSYIDPKTGEDMETIVDEDFKMTVDLKQLGATLEWRWINEVWEGTRIGWDIYVNVRPLPNQTRSMSNPSECKLPYTGYIYNNTNAQATSMVDLCKPHQYTYMIVWWRLENELAKAKGKKFVMDMAQLPKSQGWTMDQWMYYFDNMGVIMINSMEEGRQGDPNSISKFNQFTDIDMSLSQVVGQYMEVLAKLEYQVSQITGVTAQREGQIAASETVGGVERSNYQSSHITEAWFYYHNEVKKQVLTKLLETAKVAYAGGKKIHYIVDEAYTAMLNVDGETFPDSDYGLFVSNSSKDHQNKEKLEALAQVALQQDKAQLSDIIKIYRSNSISEIEATIVASEQAAHQRSLQAAQEQQAAQAQMEEAKMAWEREKIDKDAEQKQLDRQNKIEVATLQTMRGKDGPSDMNANGVPDAAEYNQIMLDQSKLAFDQMKLNQDLELKASDQIAKNKKLEADIKKQEADLSLSFAKLEAEKAKTAKEEKAFTREQNQQDAKNKVELSMKKADQAAKQKDAAAKYKQVQEDAKSKEKDRQVKLAEIRQKAIDAEKDRQIEIQKLQIEAQMRQAEFQMEMQMEERKLQIEAKADMMKAKAEAEGIRIKSRAESQAIKEKGSADAQAKKVIASKTDPNAGAKTGVKTKPKPKTK